MGCCSARTNDIMDENFVNKVIKIIIDNLEANLVNQAAFNLDLDNMLKKYENYNSKNKPEDIIRAYLELILNLTNITNDQYKADIKDFLFSSMNMSSNDFFSFHVLIYRKLQGINDYSITKAIIERDLSLKNSMKRCYPLLTEVFENLKSQKIINISQLSLDNLKKSFNRRGVKMTDNQLQNYHKILTMPPKNFDPITEKMKKDLEKHKNMKNNIEKNGNEIKSLMEEIIRGGTNYKNIDFEKFRDMCKSNDVKLEYFEIEEVYNLMQKNYFEFIAYIDNIGKPYHKYDESLEMKSFKLDTMARIDSQPLPVVNKLTKFQ